MVGTLGRCRPYMGDRIFTLAEAESLLPRLRSLLTDIGKQWNHIRELNPDVQKARDNAPFDGHSRSGVEYVESVSLLMLWIHQIKNMGVLLKDADRGLCDFPYMRSEEHTSELQSLRHLVC